MAHIHSVYDTDAHFSINPITRQLKNEASSKTSLIQHDHGSERFTFEIPRYIEGHDMALCNVVQIHYNNIDANTREQSKGVYEIDDLDISPESEEVVICSWLISENATKFAGSLNFLIRFSCVDLNAEITYAWNTSPYTGISVTNGIYNGDDVAERYADILEQWKQDLEANQIISVEQTKAATGDGEDNIWTATFGDGRTSKFKVKNGSKGDQGIHGNKVFAQNTTPTGEVGDLWINTDSLVLYEKKSNGWVKLANIHSLGHDNETIGNDSHAIGFNNKVHAHNAVATGFGNNITSFASQTHGRSLKATNLTGQTMLGRFNDGDRKAVLGVGYGIDDSNRLNAFDVVETSGLTSPSKNAEFKATVYQNGSNNYLATEKYVDAKVASAGGSVSVGQDNSAKEYYLTGYSKTDGFRLPYGVARITKSNTPQLNMGGGYQVNGTPVINSALGLENITSINGTDISKILNPSSSESYVEYALPGVYDGSIHTVTLPDGKTGMDVYKVQWYTETGYSQQIVGEVFIADTDTLSIPIEISGVWHAVTATNVNFSLGYAKFQFTKTGISSVSVRFLRYTKCIIYPQTNEEPYKVTVDSEHPADYNFDIKLRFFCK